MVSECREAAPLWIPQVEGGQMKFIPDSPPTLELTRRNLMALLAKLDDPLSYRTLMDGEDQIYVRAVEDVEHYSDREPGVMYMPTADRYV